MIIFLNVSFGSKFAKWGSTTLMHKKSELTPQRMSPLRLERKATYIRETAKSYFPVTRPLRGGGVKAELLRKIFFLKLEKKTRP